MTKVASKATLKRISLPPGTELWEICHVVNKLVTVRFPEEDLMRALWYNVVNKGDLTVVKADEWSSAPGLRLVVIPKAITKDERLRFLKVLERRSRAKRPSS